jgi:hypothetical protein
MKIPFTCPSCGASGSVDAAFAGKPARCKPCGYRFTIPTPGETKADVYALDEPVGEAAGLTAMRPGPGSLFVPSRGDEPTADAARRPKRAATGTTARPARGRGRASDVAWRAWLVRGMLAAALASAAIALLAPRGTWIVGCLLLGLGSVMVLLGYGVGAYGAFREDVLYGVLYLLVPLYAAYYLVTRWDDLWVWFACSTAGTALVLLGTEMLRWSGVGV